jgi:hypothetical protein
MSAEADLASPDQDDAEENSAITAGYTYLGQFIDHDITFDPASINQRIADRDALTDFRTPRLDLDCVYGRGPDDQPYLYREDGVRLALGEPLSGNTLDPNAHDLLRAPAQASEPRRALIGDPRNDENRIVAQLQAAFIRFHNHMADHLEQNVLLRAPTFGETREEVMFHYQWVVLHDFLPTIVGSNLVEQLLPSIDLKSQGADDKTIAEAPAQLRFYQPKRDAFMPYEFAVAAYRFGHSMVRPFYRLNDNVVAPIFSLRDEHDEILKADPPATGTKTLAGFGAIPEDWAIDWRRFFQIAGAPALTHHRKTPMHAYKIDTSLVNPLRHLPGFDNDPPPTLASRNLIRGSNLRLPSGQDVAHAIGVAPLTDEEIKIGKASVDDAKDWIELTSIDASFQGRTPLWIYILAEAMQDFISKPDDALGIRLGPVGGTIVAETLIGLILSDPTSYPNQRPGFRPDSVFEHEGGFGIAELLSAATMT